METGTVYCATNLVNQKVYIGQTVGDPKRRKDGHRFACKVGGGYFNHALRKYSIESFEWTVLCEVSAPTKLLVKEYLDIAEKMYIQQHDSMNNSKGYNLTKGGGGSIGYTHTESAKKKMSEAHKGEKSSLFGKHLSEETRNKLSKANKGKNHPMFGKHLPEETRRKMSESHKGKEIPLETRKKMSESRKGIHISLKTRKKLSKASTGENNPMFGKHHSEETRKKLSESQQGEKSPMFGKHISKETKEKISKGNKGKTRSIESRKKMSEIAKKNWEKRRAI